MSDENKGAQVLDLGLMRGQREHFIQLLDQAVGGWLEFMEQVGQHLGPIVKKAGAPSQADLNQTIVGQHGFKSWRQMIEAPREEKGLGWKWSTYQQWSKAYSTLKQVEGLREQDLTPAQINRLALAIRKENDGELPLNAESWDLLLESVEVKKADEDANKLVNVQKDAVRLQGELDKQMALYAAQSSVIDDLRGQVRESMASVASFSQTLADKDAEIKRLGIKSALQGRELEKLALGTAEMEKANVELTEALAKAQQLNAKHTSHISQLKATPLLKRIFKWSDI